MASMRSRAEETTRT